MEANPPRVSICVPVRNGEDFLGQALESVLEQSFDDYEIIVVDNASTDGTVSLIEKLIADNSEAPLRLFRNECNIGLVGNFNACLKQARGKYVKFLCADDLLLPSCLEKMAHVLDTHPSVSLVAGGRLIMDATEAKIGIQRYAYTEKTVPGKEAINRCLFGANYIGEPTAVMFRLESALRGFREEFSHLMDMEMWFYLLEQGDLAILPEPLCAIRRHSEQMTAVNIKSGALVEDNVRLFEEYARKPYIRNSWAHHALRKVRMAYRIWISRRHLESARLEAVLIKHSIPFVYYTAMPIFGRLLVLLKRIRHSSGRMN
ncbi:MAG: glycosyltransferase [Sideroxydans sp.]|nr:glycosyltransferase [Sideroxydans sp.]